MELKAVELSEQALKGIGFVVTPRQRAGIESGAEFSYTTTNGSLGLTAPLSTGSLECAPRPRKLARLERHLKTREMLVALDGDATVCVAPPQDGSKGSLTGITAVKVRTGEAFILETGAWHWIPYPAESRVARYLVVFRAGTGDDDLYYCDLSEPLNVVG